VSPRQCRHTCPPSAQDDDHVPVSRSANTAFATTCAAVAAPVPALLATPRKLLRAATLGAILSSAATLAHAAAPAWLENARAACASDYGDERCDDQHFLQQEYAPETILSTQEIARRAAVRKNRAEKKAFQEVMLKYTGLCDLKPEQYCTSKNKASCITQLQQSCAVIRQQVAACEQQTVQYCAQHPGKSKCIAAMKNQCDREDQSIDEILAKYPELSPNQKAKVKQVAAELEKNSDKSVYSALASTFLQLLGFAL
jgi:hypothetical protein